jgi:hypothetical protein
MEDGISQMRRLIFITCAFAAAARNAMTRTAKGVA